MNLSEVRNTETYYLSDFKLVRDDEGNFGIRATGEFPSISINGDYYDTTPIFVPYSEDWFDKIISKYENTVDQSISKIETDSPYDLDDLADFTDEDLDNGDEPSWELSYGSVNSDGIEAEVDFRMTRLKDSDCIENFTDPSEGKYYYEYRLYSLPKVSISVDFGII